MKDFLGQELRVGDNIVFAEGSSNGRLYKDYKILSFTKTFVEIARIDYPEYTFRKKPDKILKIDTILNNIQNET